MYRGTDFRDSHGKGFWVISKAQGMQASAGGVLFLLSPEWSCAQLSPQPQPVFLPELRQTKIIATPKTIITGINCRQFMQPNITANRGRANGILSAQNHALKALIFSLSPSFAAPPGHFGR
jgi:hypothetical protein